MTIIFFVILFSGGYNSSTYSGNYCEAFPGCHEGSELSYSLSGKDISFISGIKNHVLPHAPPEFQGRFPIRVELDSLTKEDFIQILTEPKNALVKQYTALLKSEDVHLSFKEDAIDQIAEMSALVNLRTENIGARRLQTIMEKFLEDISFDAPDLEDKNISIDASYIREKLKDIIQDEDLSRYIL